jgi:hypothetical protein
MSVWEKAMARKDFIENSDYDCVVWPKFDESDKASEDIPQIDNDYMAYMRLLLMMPPK